MQVIVQRILVEHVPLLQNLCEDSNWHVPHMYSELSANKWFFVVSDLLPLFCDSPNASFSLAHFSCVLNVCKFYWIFRQSFVFVRKTKQVAESFKDIQTHTLNNKHALLVHEEQLSTERMIQEWMSYAAIANYSTRLPIHSNLEPSAQDFHQRCRNIQTNLE